MRHARHADPALSRRAFLRATAVGLVAATGGLAGCAMGATSVAAPEATLAPDTPTPSPTATAPPAPTPPPTATPTTAATGARVQVTRATVATSVAATVTPAPPAPSPAAAPGPPPPPPAISAAGAIVWDASGGIELFAKAPDERLDPSSTTKMLSALLVIEGGRLDRQVTVAPGDFGPEDESRMPGLAPGDVVTLEDLLYGMLLSSGGDAARAAARTVGADLLAGMPGDPAARFVQEMNARVARLGLANTHFINPDGYEAPGHYSSARDLLVIANEALKQPLFARMVATRQITRLTVDGGKAFALTNTNALLGEREGVHGVKTGTVEYGVHENLVTAQWAPRGRLLSVVLASAGRYADTVALLDWTNAAYR